MPRRRRGKVLCAKLFDGGSHAALTARSAAGTDADCAEGQVKIIVGNDQVFHRQFVEMQKSLHRLSRKIHVGLRLGEEYLPLLVQRGHDNRFGLQFHTARIEPHRNAVNQHEADVVAGVFVFASRVAQADDEIRSFQVS